MKRSILADSYVQNITDDVSIVETDSYVELDIMAVIDGEPQKVGFAEINLATSELTQLKIYEPFQNQGLGQQALQQIIDTYEVRSVNVLSDNDRAIHLYEKYGFEESRSSMIEMTR